MALATEDRRFAEVNPALLKLLSYSRDEVAGRPIAAFLPPSVEPVAESVWQRFLEEGEAFGERELVRADGTRLRFEYAARTELITGRRLALIVLLHADAQPEAEERGDTTPSEDSFSPREHEVVELIAVGRRDNEIAEQLSLAPATVHTHVRNAKRKIGARNRAHLVAVALGQGLIQPDGSQ